MEKQRILFIGAGSMAEAIVSGLVRKSADNIEKIVVSNRSDKERLLAIHEKYDVDYTQDWKQVISDTNVVILAMPPEAHDRVLKEMTPLLINQFVITIAAGISLSYLEERLPANTATARIMPNTAAAIGESITLFTCGKHAKSEHEAVLQMVVDGIGEGEACTEEDIYQLTAVTGSAPAFVYYFAESLINVTKDLGYEDEKAKKLVIQMMRGSINMLNDNPNPATLRENVTTPGGSTAEGLKVFYENNFANIMKEAIDATNRKARGE